MPYFFNTDDKQIGSFNENLIIRASLAPRNARFPLHTIFTQGPKGPFHSPRNTLFPLRTIFTQGPEGPFRVLEKAGR